MEYSAHFSYNDGSNPYVMLRNKELIKKEIINQIEKNIDTLELITLFIGDNIYYLRISGDSSNRKPFNPYKDNKMIGDDI